MDIARLGIRIRYYLNLVHIRDLTGPHQEAQLRTYQVCNRDTARSFVRQQLLKAQTPGAAQPSRALITPDCSEAGMAAESKRIMDALDALSTSLSGTFSLPVSPNSPMSDSLPDAGTLRWNSLINCVT